jgi:APA family basic amino acid/polyamine antiporter
LSVFATKNLAELHADVEASGLRRALGLLDLTALGVGCTIGAGIFVLTGQAAAQYAGPGIVLSYLLAGVVCGFAGLCYAEFAGMIPISGSAYTYAYATLGEIAAWTIGWALIAEYSFAAAAVAVGWSGYLVSVLRDVGIALPAALAAPLGSGATDGTTALFNAPAVAVVLVLTAVLVRGIRLSATLNAVVVLLKVAVILVFVVAGAPYVDSRNWTPFVPENSGRFGEFGWSGVLRGASVVFMAYLGFDAVSVAAQEAKNPRRDLPLGTLASLAVCAVLYMAVAAVVTGIVPYARLDVPDPIAVGIDATGLGWLRPLVKLGALLALSSVILVLLLAQPRILLTMGRDGLLSPLFARVHPRHRTPHVTTLLTGVAVAAMAGLFPIGPLSELVSLATLFIFAIVCVGIPVLRRRSPQLERPFRMPGVPWLPLLGAAFCVYLMLGLPLAAWIRLAVWMTLGLAIYFGYGRGATGRARLARS